MQMHLLLILYHKTTQICKSKIKTLTRVLLVVQCTKFDTLYNLKQKNNLQEGKKLSIQTRADGSKYVKVDIDQDIFEGIDEKDFSKIAKMYMQDYLEGKTKLSENDNVNIGNKGISKYTNPTQKTKYMTEKMKLSIELKNVLNIAEKIDISEPTKDTSKFPNWEYYKVEFEINGKSFEGLINIGIDKNGNKHFYEINKIHTTANSYISTSKSSSTDSIKNSISSSSENVNSDYSMQEKQNYTQDNKGRTLTKEQQNYFKDSKVRDENGNLKTVYHGTNKAGFTEFNRNINFYTDNKNVAKTYTGNNGMYEEYVNITNPVTINANGEMWSMIDVDNITIGCTMY